MTCAAAALFAVVIGACAPRALPAAVAAQDAAQAPDAPQAPARPMRMQMRQDMSAMHQQMMEEQKAAAARLESLRDELAQAQGDARLDAIAALLLELTSQHLAHQQRMGRMMGMMAEP